MRMVGFNSHTGAAKATRAGADIRVPSALVAVAAVATGILTAYLNASMSALILLVSAGLIVAPLGWRIAVGGRDRWLEPVVWAGLTMFGMYVVRPAALLGFDRFERYGFDLTANFEKVLLLTLTGAISLYLGYFLFSGIKVAKLVPPPPDKLDPSTTLVMSSAFALAGFALFAIAAIQTGAPILNSMVSGFRVDFRATTGYLYMAPTMALPAALLIFRTGSELGSRAIKAAGVSIAVIVALILAPAGNRFATILFITPFLIYVMLRNDWRPKAIPLLSVILIALTFVAATERFAPGKYGPSAVAGAMKATLGSPATSIEKFVTGPTIEMFDGLLIEQQLVPSILPHKPFSSITTTIGQPVPRLLWPSKPYAAEAVMNEAAFGARGVRAGDASVAYSPIGGFYYDSGWIGVVIGMAGIGWTLKVLWQYFRLHRSNDVVHVFFSISLPLVIVLMRGNIPDTLARAAFFLFPLLTISWLSRVKPGRARLPN